MSRLLKKIKHVLSALINWICFLSGASNHKGPDFLFNLFLTARHCTHCTWNPGLTCPYRSASFDVLESARFLTRSGHCTVVYYYPFISLTPPHSHPLCFHFPPLPKKCGTERRTDGRTCTWSASMSLVTGFMDLWLRALDLKKNS